MTPINPLLKLFMGIMNLIFPNSAASSTEANKLTQQSDSAIVVNTAKLTTSDSTLADSNQISNYEYNGDSIKSISTNPAKPVSLPPKRKNFDIPLTEAASQAKSLRLITGHTSETLPKGTFELTIQHRFGQLNSGAENLYGIDNLNSMRIGFDFALGNRVTLGLGRSSMRATYNSYFKWRIVGSPERKFNLTYLADASLDGRPSSAWGVTPFFYSHRLAYTHQLIASLQLGQKLVLGVAPSVVHFNLVDQMAYSNDIPVVHGYLRRSFGKKIAFTAEGSYIPQGLISNPTKTQPTVGFGFEYFTPRHAFQISLTNSRSLNEPYFLVSDVTNGSLSNFCLGFNLVRRW